MTKYETLLDLAGEKGLEVVEKEFKSEAKGLCNGDRIGIRKDLSRVEKVGVLAEEIGHALTSAGDILDLSVPLNAKQETIARRWAYRHLISMDDLVKSIADGCTDTYSIAEELGVSAEFLLEALEYFKSKYGIYETEEYTIVFHDCGYRVFKPTE